MADTTTTTTVEDKNEREALLRKAYSKATQDLRDKHRGDFEAFYSARAAEVGVEWTPRKTPEQKAAEEFEALLEQYPHLAHRLPVTGTDA